MPPDQTVRAPVGSLYTGSSSLVPYIPEQEVLLCIERALPLLHSIISDDTIIVVNREGAVWFVNKILEGLQRAFGVNRASQTRLVKLTSAMGGGKHGEIVTHDWFADPTELKGKKVVVPEDINDTGRTLKQLKTLLLDLGALEVTTVALFEKEGVEKVFVPDHSLRVIENRYIVGSGLDDGQGNYRELPGLYEVIFAL